MADGHGASRYFRSLTGAQAAVRAAQKVLEDLAVAPEAPSPGIRDQLARNLVRRWQGIVTRHARRKPFSEEERAVWRGELDEWPFLPYGSTILAALAAPGFAALVQLGDGDILILDEDDSVTRLFEPDPMQVGEETNSLATLHRAAGPQGGVTHVHDPWTDALVHCLSDSEARSKRLILLATDGYAKSFATRDDFHKVALDLWTMLREQGPSVVEAGLGDWLTATSAEGSGDDITVGVLYRSDLAAQATGIGG